MTRLLDSLLDRSLVGGYSRVGYALRARGFAELPRMDGRTAVVTGATSGLGLAAATGFARLGARVILVARDAQRGERARAQVAEHGDDVALELTDLSDRAAVRALGGRLAAGAPIDVLVNNAGVLTAQRELSVDGIELTLATNVLAPFLLTHLLPTARRVITVSSGGMYAQKLDVDDLQSERGDFSPTKAYAKSKRAEVVLAELWARRRDPAVQAVHAMHPGWVDTPGLAASLPGFHRATRPLLRTAQQGADTIVWLGATDQPSGRFWHDRAARPTHYVPWTKETAQDRARLWDACEALALAR